MSGLEISLVPGRLNSHVQFTLPIIHVGIVHSPSSYVRDFYFFHRSFYPQLTLVKQTIDTAQLRMKDVSKMTCLILSSNRNLQDTLTIYFAFQAAFVHKFIDVGKVLLTYNILKHSPQNVVSELLLIFDPQILSFRSLNASSSCMMS